LDNNKSTDYSIKREDIVQVAKDLEARAIKEKWCINNFHCILRIVYDYACLGDWRKHVKPPAYQNLNDEQYKRAIYILEKLKTSCPEGVELLNLASLQWRGKWISPS